MKIGISLRKFGGVDPMPLCISASFLEGSLDHCLLRQFGFSLSSLPIQEDPEHSLLCEQAIRKGDLADKIGCTLGSIGYGLFGLPHQARLKLYQWKNNGLDSVLEKFLGLVVLESERLVRSHTFLRQGVRD